MADLAFCFADLPTATYAGLYGAGTTSDAPPGYFVGMRRKMNGKTYVFQQADDAITVNQAVKLDVAASSTGLKVTPTAAVGDSCYGVAETALTDEYYGWITVEGVASCLVLNGTAADDPLAASGTAGVLQKAAEAGSGDYEFVVASAMQANGGGSPAAFNVMLNVR